MVELNNKKISLDNKIITIGKGNNIIAINITNQYNGKHAIQLSLKDIISNNKQYVMNSLVAPWLASESISCNYASQEDFTIGFKGSVLLQLLQNIGTDNVKFLLKEPNRPCVIREAEPNSMYDYTSLCMPMLINN